MGAQTRVGTEVRKILKQLPPGWVGPSTDGRNHFRLDGPNGEIVQWPNSGRHGTEGSAFWLRKKLKKHGLEIK